MKVHLKERPTDKTRKKLTLYLVYADKGKRKYEFLNLYKYNDQLEGLQLTSDQKKHNKQVLELAEDIRAKRHVEVQSHMHGVIPEHKKNFNFFTFYNELLDKRKSSQGNHGNWYSALKHLKEFTKIDDITFGNIDELFAENFKTYLLKKVSRNSAASYFNKLRATMNEAFEQRMIACWTKMEILSTFTKRRMESNV